MTAYTRDEIISATDLARNLSSTLTSITNKTREKIAIAKNNKLEAIIIDIEEYERLKEAYEMLEHLEIAKIVDDRKTGEFITGDDTLKELGLALDV